jgi:glycosyltransferase involved in cell wall biosynthesis
MNPAPKHLISVVITTYNEAHIIGQCLAKLAWAAEVLIVDSYSTDSTVAIAKSYGARVLERAYQYPADQKNYAIPLATFERILLLDADEILTDSLIIEVIETLNKDVKNAYSIKRKNYFLGKQVKYSGWQNDVVVRLINRDLHRFKDMRVHESIDIENRNTTQLNACMLHYTYKNTAHFLNKIERYAMYKATDLANKNTKITMFHLYLKPAMRFVRQYVFKLGFLDGNIGLVVCRLAAHEQFLRALYTLELMENQPKKPS